MNNINQSNLRVNFIWLVVLIALLSINSANALSSSFQVVGTGYDYTELEFNLEGYELIQNRVNGVEYTRIYHPEAGYMFHEGLPEIPFFTVMLAIPETGTAHLEEMEVSGTEIKGDFLFFPSQGPDMVISDDLGFLKDEAFYKSNESYPADLMNIGKPGILRDFRYVNIVLFPFSYNPVKEELTIHHKIRLRVNYERSELGTNEITRPSRRLSRSFENIYQGAFLNYEQFRNPDLEYQARSILVVYHHDPIIEPIVNEYIDWKREKGFEVGATNTATLTSNTAIKNYIQNAYDTWENPPEYIMLIGGGSGSFSIPTFYVYSAYGDHPYGLLEGNDDIPDAFVGRLPFAESTQLQTMWNKIRKYEREPYLDNLNWYEHTLLVGDATTSSGISPKFTMKYVKELMLLYNEDYQFTEHYSGSASTVINNAFNAGISFFPFRGWLGMAGWSPSSTALNNGLMLPNCFFLTCSTLNFNNTSNTEAIVNMGTPVASKGAITAIGMNTSSTKTAFNNAYTGAFFYGIFNEGIRTMGETLARGKIFIHQTWDVVHPSQPPYHTQKASLMGDPSLDIWVENPKPLDVTYNQSLPLGTNYIDISVTDQYSQPVENAWVTIRQVVGDNETIFVTGYTDINGTITHVFSSESSGTVNVTVTKPGYIPHLGTFSFDDGLSVSLYNTFVNGVPNAGEEVGFVLTLKNYLDRTASNVNATLSIDSDFIDVISNSSNYPDMAIGGTAESISEYIVEISPNTPSGHRAFFDLIINESFFYSWTSRFVLTVNNGNLVLSDISFSGGGVLEPGQIAEMFITLLNNGSVGVSDLYGVISGAGSGLTIIDSEAYFGTIASGGQGTNSVNNFVLSASGNIIPGTIFNAELFLYNSSGFEQTVPFSFNVGTVTVDDPLGPDAYGYRCYDDGDIGYIEAPEYNWIEIAPTQGGSGVNTGLESNHSNNQQVMVMDLPFTFSFYGVEYDVISICANGWIHFGVTEQATFRNYILPGPMGPNPMIAAFWDNLSLAQGGVFTYYDLNNDIFIIQWENALNVVGSAPETFQIILYDPAYHYSVTGDGNIKIQYKIFNNVNNSTASGEWSNYCTIGIDDHTGNVGMTYTFANQYPTAARVLNDESAIFFTTGAIDYDNAYLTIETVSYSGGVSYLPQYGETLSINMSLNNIGGATAGVISATLLTEDAYVTVLNNSANFGVIDAGGIVTVNDAFTISIADNVPDQHSSVMILQIQSDLGMYWQRIFHMDIQAPLLEPEQPLVYDMVPDGNNDGIIDPGELITLVVPIKNIGGADSPPVDMNFVSNHPQVAILDIIHNELPMLIAGETMYPTLVLDVGNSIDIGTFFTISYNIVYGNYSINGNLDLSVGGELTVQMGSGTATNGTSTANPINIYYRSLRGQTVYTATELHAAGMTAGGLLTSFGFYVTSSPTYALPNFLIRMKHTTATDASNHDPGPFTSVFETPSYMPVAGDWDMLTLTTPFQWNGVDNILVDTAFSQVPSWTSSGQQRIYTVTNGFRFVRADNSDQTNATTTSTSSNKPQAQLVFFGITAGDVDTRPQNLTIEIIDDTVYLEWQPPQSYQAILLNGGEELLNNASSNTGRAISNQRTDNERTLLGYNIYRNGIKINQQVVIITSYEDDEIETLTNYYYYVTAVYDTGESIPSNIAYIELENWVDMPSFNPVGGYYNEPQLVSLTVLQDNVTIRYTTDGNDPNETSPIYTEPILISEVTTLKARGYKDNWIASETGEERYIIMYSPQEVSIQASDNQVTLQWQVTPGATGYAVYTSDNINGDDWILVGNTVTNQYIYQIPLNRTMGFFKVKAIYEETPRFEEGLPTRIYSQ